MKRGKAASIHGNTATANPARDRILAAAFAAFTEHGFAAARTLDIATRARVSKRELYALFASKQQILVTCISERARRMRLPADSVAPRNRLELEARLAEFGKVLLSELTEPVVIALFRLAISEADRSPEVGRALDLHGGRAASAALRELLDGARSAGLLSDAEVEALASRFMSLLLEDLPLSLALGLRNRPGKQEIERRAFEAVRTALELGGSPGMS
jgi:AcrR family transcriptional regulator